MTNVKDKVYVCTRLLKNFKVELKRVAIRWSDMLVGGGVEILGADTSSIASRGISMGRLG